MPARTVNNIEAESSRKRSRQAVSFQDDNDEDQVIDVQRARSNLRGDNTRKRARTSHADSVQNDRRPKRNSTPVSSDDDDAHESVQDQEQNQAAPASPDSPPKTQYELLRDNNFEHLRHETADDQRATQRLRFRPNLLGDNAVADNGIIESITCVNFMCHQRLHCELGPLLNFIVGENGSGKSAILTAITLCLGGKASSTNRGGSLKSFVKEGSDRAVLTVKIKNQGQDAYRQDIYGDSIIVERHFSKTGSSGFKVKTAMGQTYSTKKQEVEEIVEYYALQVDNPLNVLSQDNARQFLNASTKAQKYKFFIEGVQLQQLDNDYRLISESLEQMVAKVPDQEERVKHAKENLIKAKRLKEAIEGNRQIRIKYRTLRHQLVWAQVVDQERELARREKVLADAVIKVAEAEREVEEKTQALQISDEKIEAAQEKVDSAKADKKEFGTQVKVLEETYNQSKIDLQQLHTNERDAHTALKSAMDTVKVLTRKIAAEEKRLQDANGEAHAAKTHQLEEAKAEVQRIKDEITANKSKEPEIISQLENAKKSLGRVGDEFSQKQLEMEAARTKVRDIQKSSGGLYDGYEPNVPRLVKMIADETRFSQKPIGPLGTHIKLLKPQWSSILERTFGLSLNGFIVTSSPDKKILTGLMERLNIRNCPIFVGNGRALDITGREPDEAFDTILRVLKIDNQMVRDQLIINHAIEQQILIPERDRGEKVMFRTPPRHVKACLCFHDKKRGEGLRLTSNAAKGIATEPVRVILSLRPRMQTDNDSQLAYHREIVQGLEADCRAIENNKRRIQQDVQRLQKELNNLKKDRTSLETSLRHARLAEDKISADLDQFDGADGRLQGLREQLVEAEAKKEHHGGQYGTLANKKNEKNASTEELYEKFKEQKLLLKDHDNRVTKFEDKLKRLQEARRIILAELNEAVSAVELSKEERDKAEKKRADQEKDVVDMTRQAKDVSDTRMHIPDNESYKTIEKQYETLGKRLQEEEKKTGMSDQQVNEYLVEANKGYEKAVSDLESIKEVNAGLRSTLNLRLEKWRKFQRYISSQSRANFIYLLSERGFRGKLLLDHERKALDLQVEPDKTEKRAAGRNTKTLSGGEKSFSSICLLLSIWEAMGSPLRCLDEFDVFMDNVNRAISTNMLITAARRSVNRQYIFITPNAIEGRNTLDKDVKIIRLTDPRQRTLADH